MCCLCSAIPLRATLGAVEDALRLLLRESVEGMIGIRLLLFVETSLQTGNLMLLIIHVKMLIYSTFRIRLHGRVDGGVDFQTIGIYIIWCTVGFEMLWIVEEVLQVGAHILTEIGSLAGGMVFLHKLQYQRFFLIFLTLFFRDKTIFLHLGNHNVAASLGLFWTSARVVTARCFQHTDQQCRLLYGKFLRSGVEIAVRSRLNTHGLMRKIYRIEVKGEDFILRVFPFEHNGHNPFLQFRLHQTHPFLSGIEVLSQLLGNGTTTAVIAVEHQSHGHTAQRTDVDTRVFVKTGIFGGEKGVDDVGRQIRVAAVGAVLHKVAAHLGAIGIIHDGGLLVVGDILLQLLQ